MALVLIVHSWLGKGCREESLVRVCVSEVVRMATLISSCVLGGFIKRGRYIACTRKEAMNGGKEGRKARRIKQIST